MKKSLSIVALLLSISAGAMAQKQVLFKIKYNPNQHYAMLMKMNMNMEMNVSGDSAMINKIKASGQSFPMIMTMDMATNGDIKTGAINKASQIPFTMIVGIKPAKMTMNGKEMAIPMPATNETLFGTSNSQGALTIDSVSGKKDPAVKASMSKLIENLTANIKFPEKAMKVGESFVQDVPMDMPMAGMTTKMDCKVTYTLVSINGDKANFDLKYDIKSDINSGAAGQAMAITMTGDGDGKMLYDISTNYATSMVGTMNITYAMTMPQAPTMKMDGKMKMGMDVQTTITKD